MDRSSFGLRSSGWVSLGCLLMSVACSDGDIESTKDTGGAGSHAGGGTATGGSRTSTGGTKSTTGGTRATATGGSAVGGQSTGALGGSSNTASGGTSGITTAGTAGTSVVATGGTAVSSSIATGGTAGTSAATGGTSTATSGGFAGTGGVAACGTTVGSNVLTNAGFETGTAHGATIPGWVRAGATQADIDASFLEYQTAHAGYGRLTNWSNTAFKVTTSQTVSSIPNGTYTLTAWIMRDTRFTTQYLFASSYSAADSAAKMTVDTASASSTVYTQITLSGIQVTNGTCEVGLYSEAADTGVWANLDDFSLVRVGGVGCISGTGGATSTGGTSSVSSGGQSSTGGSVTTGGVSPTGGTVSTGGVSTTGGASAGETTSTGGDVSTGGTATGGDVSTGGTATGGDVSTGGTATGGDVSTGGTVATGGLSSTGGSTATGGTASTGGVTSTSGTSVNLLTNPGFEGPNSTSADVPGWVETGTIDDSWVEWGSNAHSGSYFWNLYGASPYTVTLTQTVSSLPNGTYTFSAWVTRGAGFNSLNLFAWGFDSSSPSLNANSDSANASGYSQIVLSGIVVTSGQCNVGVYADGQAGAWAHLDDFSFTKNP